MKQVKLIRSVIIMCTNICYSQCYQYYCCSYTLFFYKNILLSSVIVFLIANKITSSDFGDEEDEWQLREKRLWWMSARWREAAGLSCVNARMFLFCTDMGADGQFAPLDALTVLLHKRSAGALSQSSHCTRLARPISS